MPFNEAVKVTLYARSGNRCAYPRCSVPLVFTLEKFHNVANDFSAVSTNTASLMVG